MVTAERLRPYRCRPELRLGVTAQMRYPLPFRGRTERTLISARPFWTLAQINPTQPPPHCSACLRRIHHSARSTTDHARDNWTSAPRQGKHCAPTDKTEKIREQTLTPRATCARITRSRAARLARLHAAEPRSARPLIGGTTHTDAQQTPRLRAAPTRTAPRATRNAQAEAPHHAGGSITP